ncbi:MAG: hypothetical protein JSU94_04175 [Phycisphaerales bacterium]|nr:MAG: hypothetical protein JSU94_04175 [Phycisphaerales bacterium]
MRISRAGLSLNMDLKSVIIGFLLAICLILVMGAQMDDEIEKDVVGQYQCCAAGGDDLSVFVIDTETGQTWRLGRTDTYNFGTPFSRKSVRKSIMPMVD